MLDTFPAILTNTFIQQQKTELAQLQSQYAQMGDRLGERHPDMVKLRSAIQVTQAKLDGEIGKVVQGVKNEYLAALAKENSLAGALNAQKGDALAMNRKAIDYSVLDREVQSGRQLYDSLLQRAKETGVSTELKTSNIRIVDRAERPLGPVSPQKGLNLLLALFGGIARRVRAGVLLRVSRQPDQDARRDQDAPRAAAPRAAAGARREGAGHGLSAGQQGRSRELRRSVPGRPDQRAVLVRAGGIALGRGHEHRARAKARAWWRATSPSRSPRPASARC